MAITLATAQTNLDRAASAYARALEARSFSVGEMSVQLQDVNQLRDQLTYWQRVVDQLGHTGQTTTQVGRWGG